MTEPATPNAASASDHATARQSTLMFTRRNEPGWVGITAREGHVRAAYAVRTGPRPTLQWLRHTRYEPGSDVEALVAMRKTMALHKGYRCGTVIGPDVFQTLEVPAPKVDRSEWREALRWVVKDSLEFPIEEAMIDAMAIPTEGAPAGREPMAFVVAARRDAVAGKVQLFQRAKLRLKVVSVGTMAQRNVAALFEEPQRGLAFFAMHELAGLLTFSCDGAIYAQRHLNYAVEATADSTEPDRRSREIDRVCLDIQRSLDSFDRQFSHVSVPRVVVAVPAGHNELLNALRHNLSQTVELADLRKVMDLSACPEVADPHAQVFWLMAIGMALRLEGDL